MDEAEQARREAREAAYLAVDQAAYRAVDDGPAPFGDGSRLLGESPIRAAERDAVARAHRALRAAATARLRATGSEPFDPDTDPARPVEDRDMPDLPLGDAVQRLKDSALAELGRAVLPVVAAMGRAWAGLTDEQREIVLKIARDKNEGDTQ